ncbi:hypothetical protein TNCV_1621561 [Trichonephila clavipes]|nr:hypothetical protein TNCV_1621561 [Trichonephila clavipes]
MSGNLMNKVKLIPGFINEEFESRVFEPQQLEGQCLCSQKICTFSVNQPGLFSPYEREHSPVEKTNQRLTFKDFPIPSRTVS